MKDVDEFLDEYRSLMSKDEDFWKNRIPARPDLAENESWHRKQMALLNEENTLDMIIREISGKDDFAAHQSLFEILSRHLYKEIYALMQGVEYKVFQEIRIAFFPLSSLIAVCFNQDLRHNGSKSRLTGNVVILSEGLYYSIRLLVKGYIFELVTGDLRVYHRSGSRYYDFAVKSYESKDKSCSLKHSISVQNETHQAQLSINQSLITMIIIKFVALHEVGHIYHGDLESNESLSLSFIKMSEGDSKHAREYRADLYALKKICDQAKDDRGKWSNFLAVYLFFIWLAKLKIPSDKHPDPEKRMERLLEFMKSYVGNYEAHKEEVEWVRGMVECWEEELSEESS